MVNLVAVWHYVSYFLRRKMSMVLLYGLRKWEIDCHTATKPDDRGLVGLYGGEKLGNIVPHCH